MVPTSRTTSRARLSNVVPTCINTPRCVPFILAFDDNCLLAVFRFQDGDFIAFPRCQHITDSKMSATNGHKTTSWNHTKGSWDQITQPYQTKISQCWNGFEMRPPYASDDGFRTSLIKLFQGHLSQWDILVVRRYFDNVSSQYIFRI